ncbi:MAG: ribonuclease III [Eggerthellaceae bacterium]|nr:ribonuclease III [Eggerthellaceae bacterium]
MSTDEQREKLDRAQDILQYRFGNEQYLLAAITHPSAVEGKPLLHSYERLEFLGDSILGAVVADAAFHAYPDLDEGGLTRIKVSLVSGASLSSVAEQLGFADFIIFGQSERGTGRRGLHSVLENVYESIVAALFLDGGLEPAHNFISSTLITQMSEDMAFEPENPKSALQEKLQEEGITPTYKLVETQGPPHDRTFITQVYAGLQALASGVGRTKKESESHAANAALQKMSEGTVLSKEEQRAARQAEKAQAKAKKAEEKAARAAERKAKKDAARSGGAQG